MAYVYLNMNKNGRIQNFIFLIQISKYILIQVRILHYVLQRLSHLSTNSVAIHRWKYVVLLYRIMRVVQEIPRSYFTNALAPQVKMI